MKLPSDFGPVYTETNLSGFPVEPFNTFSNLLFLVVCLYWLKRLNTFENKEFKILLKFCLPLLLIGFVGGTLYHATRSHIGWMLMDIVPIYFIAIATSIYHWRLINLNWFQILAANTVLLILPLTFLWGVAPEFRHTTTLGYLCLVISVLAPLLVDLYRTNFVFLIHFLIPLVLISLALSFRTLDSSLWVQTHLNTGTHWLWHIFGALNCHFLVKFMAARSKYQLASV